MTVTIVRANVNTARVTVTIVRANVNTARVTVTFVRANVNTARANVNTARVTASIVAHVNVTIDTVMALVLHGDKNEVFSKRKKRK